MKPLIDIHVHSHYSLLDGVSSPKKNVERAKALGTPALGISDHGVVSGVFEHYWACKDAGIKPILGCELYLKENLNDETRHYYHGIAFAMNEVGFRNLMKLCSLGGSEDHYKYRRPCVSFADLFKYSEGIAYSTGCMIGIVGIANRKRVQIGEKEFGPWEYGPSSIQEAENHFALFNKHFKGRLFVEIGPAKVDHDWSKLSEGFINGKKKVNWGFKLRDDVNGSCLQTQHNKRAIYLARRFNLPMIVASDAHMCDPKLKDVQDILIKNSVGNSNGWHFHQVHAMFSSEDAWTMFQEHHPYIKKEWFEEAIENTYRLNDIIEDFTIKFPTQVPKYLKRIEPKSRFALMEMMKRVGRVQTVQDNVEYMRRLDEEIKVIAENGIVDYTDYFLILADLVRHAGEIGVGVGPARGSAGGCLLSYLLGITAIDPIKYNLSFVRFLNVGRLKSGHPPDIDTDFTNRDPIIKYIEDTYGHEHVAMVGAFQTIKTKAALKDIVRAMSGGHLDADHPVHKICRTIDTAPQYYPSERMFLEGFTDDDDNHHPGLLDSNKDLRDFLNKNSEIKHLLFSMLETPRHLSKHAGGIVITPGPIDEVIPTKHWQHHKCTQVDFKTLEKIGGLKIDILGVNTLNYIWGAVKRVKDRHGVDLDPWNLPLDQKSLNRLTEGDTSTVFQFDTQVVRPFLKQIGPKSVDDLIFITSVARPGCLDSTLEDGKSVAEHYIARKTGVEPTPTIDPLLFPIVGETFGLFIFQEQIQKVFEVVGGLTEVESDDARRAIGKKNLQVLIGIKKQLFEGAKTLHGWEASKCEALWNSFIGAANYAFNRAHATAYGIIAYACAYLKHNYNREWWCSVLSAVESDKIRVYLPEIDEHIEFPNVNNPEFQWTISKNDKLVPPLTLVRAIGDKAVEEIKSKAPFISFDDYIARIDKRKANKVVTINLIFAGCFTDLEGKDDPEELLTKFFLSRKEAVPPQYQNLDRTDLIRERVKLLSIASFDYTDYFSDAIKSEGYNGGTKWKYTESGGIRFMDKCPIVADAGIFETLYLTYKSPVVFIGMVLADSKTFYYKDRKTGSKVGAFRLLLENNKKSVETVVWPNTLKQIDKKDFEEGNLVAIFGELGYSDFKKAVEIRYLSHKRIL